MNSKLPFFHWLVLLLLIGYGQSSAAEGLPEVVVYKSPSCGCCSKWIEHLEQNGFSVVPRDTSEIERVKGRLGIPASLQSCHTAEVDGYLIEGHVPAADIKRLLTERPAVRGLAVPGMPTGSPGMEVAGGHQDEYSTIAFDAAGNLGLFARH